MTSAESACHAAATLSSLRLSRASNIASAAFDIGSDTRPSVLRMAAWTAWSDCVACADPSLVTVDTSRRAVSTCRHCQGDSCDAARMNASTSAVFWPYRRAASSLARRMRPRRPWVAGAIGNTLVGAAVRSARLMVLLLDRLDGCLVRPARHPLVLGDGRNREHAAVVRAHDLPLPLMHHPVMPKAQKAKVGEVGGSAVDPVCQMVARSEACLPNAAGPHAALIANSKRFALRAGDASLGAADIDHGRVRAEQDAGDRAVARQPLDRL